MGSDASSGQITLLTALAGLDGLHRAAHGVNLCQKGMDDMPITINCLLTQSTHTYHLLTLPLARPQGNAAFKSGRYERAAAAYTEGLKQLSTDDGHIDKAKAAVLYCNRAACWQHQGQYLEALRDAACALTLDGSSVRAAQRSAAALMAMGK
jgi:tetratricopeptide (TPR) repeat protein